MNGTLEFKEPAANSKGDIYGWEIGLRIDSNQKLQVGEKIRFLYSNKESDVFFICDQLKIDSQQRFKLKSLETHFPKSPFPQQKVVTPEVPCSAHVYETELN